MTTVLIIDDEANLRKVIGGILQKNGYEILEASNGIEALKIFRASDIIITDLKMPKMGGIEFIEELKNRDIEDIPVIILTAYSTIETAIKAIKLGAFDYIRKPFDKNELISIIKKAESFLSHEQYTVHINKPAMFTPIINSKSMKPMMEKIDRIAKLDVNILLTGETGTGKTIMAQYIHSISKRRNKPFIKVNCSAIPENLIESELFGHKKGAFTGAFETKPGKFQLSDGGTLFLDEIGEFPLNIQAKLLHAIQEKDIQMIGCTETQKVDTRIITATNRDLLTMVREGRFREDLFYRLNNFEFVLPPLKDRINEIEEIILFFTNKIALKYNLPNTNLDSKSIKKIKAYKWPGNLRELENTLERKMLLGELTFIWNKQEEMKDEKGTSSDSLILSEIENQIIKKALYVTGNNITKASVLLGISRRTLYKKLKTSQFELFTDTKNHDQ